MFDIFPGPIQAHAAEVYVQWSGANSEDVRIEGNVEGPICKYASTLPSHFALRDLGPGPAPLARTTMIDPCFWTMDVPAYYRVTASLVKNGETIQQIARDLPLRRMAMKPSGLAWEGKRFVPRMVEPTFETTVAEWRETRLCLFHKGIPTAARVMEAMVHGIPLMVQVEQLSSDRQIELTQLPGICGVVTPMPGEFRFSQQAPQLLWGQSIESTSTPIDPAADFLVAPAKYALAVSQKTPRPIFARRPTAFADLVTARRACDALQADLAPLACGGLIVESSA